MTTPARTAGLATSLAKWVRKERPATAVRVSFGFLVLGILAAGSWIMLFWTLARERVTLAAALWGVACVVFGPLACWFSGMASGVVWLFKRHRTALTGPLLLIGVIFTVLIISVVGSGGNALVPILVLLGPICWLSGAVAALIGLVIRSGNWVVCILSVALNAAACVAYILGLPHLTGFGPSGYS